MLYIGIDLGTSAVKLLLMDQEGTVQNVSPRSTPWNFPTPAGASRTRRTGGAPSWRGYRSS